MDTQSLIRDLFSETEGRLVEIKNKNKFKNLSKTDI